MNITHELLDRADFLSFGLGGIVLAHRHGMSRLRRLPQRLRPAYATGVHINLETATDVTLHMPHGFPGRPRAFYIQFKAGAHRDWCEKEKGRFQGGRSNPKPHLKFEINNNTKRDQHLQMRELANKVRPSSVLYALPRVATMSSFRARLGNLVEATTWLSAEAVDKRAKTEGVDIRRGEKHDIRMNYSGSAWEIHSEPTFLGIPPDVIPDVISDVFAVRAWRASALWADYLSELVSHERHDAIQHAFDAHRLHAAEYLGIESHAVRQVTGLDLRPEEVQRLDNASMEAQNRAASVDMDAGDMSTSNREVAVRQRRQLFSEIDATVRPLKARMLENPGMVIEMEPPSRAADDPTLQRLEIPIRAEPSKLRTLSARAFVF